MISDHNREAIEKIKETNEKDFEVLITAIQLYCCNRDSESPIRVVGEFCLNVITHIFDKYGVKYFNDLQ